MREHPLLMQFTEGLKLVVRIRALKDAQSAARKEGKA